MKKIILSIILISASVTSFSSADFVAQSITINIDDVQDPNAIPDLLASLNYNGPAGTAAKAAFIKAHLVQHMKDLIRQYRKQQAAAAAGETTIPID